MDLNYLIIFVISALNVNFNVTSNSCDSLLLG